MRMPKVIISDKASYTLMLSPPRWRKPTHQYLLNYYNIIKQKIPQPSQGSGNSDSGLKGESIEFTEPGSYTWTVPKGVRTIYVSATAGGGGGAGGGSDAHGSSGNTYYVGGTGGHGACINREPTIVTPQQTIDITVGSGGAGDTSGVNRGRNGSAGTATIVGELTLAGGGGGYPASYTSSITTVYGSNGTSPSPNGTDTSSWGSYASRGSGGSGGIGGVMGYGRPGSSGKNGYVRIEW